MSDDEFDQLRERIENLEAEAGIDHEDDESVLDGVEGHVFLELIDEVHSLRYVPVGAVTEIEGLDRPAEQANPTRVHYDESLASDGSSLGSGRWWTSEINILTRAEVEAEIQ